MAIPLKSKRLANHGPACGAVQTGGFLRPLGGQESEIAAESESPGEQMATLIAGQARRHWTASAPERRLAGLLPGSGTGLAPLARLYEQGESLIRRHDCAAPTACALPAPRRAMAAARLATGAPLGDSAGR